MSEADPNTLPPQPPDHASISEQAVQPQPAKKQRDVKYWLLRAAAVLIGLPLLLYIFAWVLINFGFLNKTIERRLSKALGVRAHVESVRFGNLQDVRINGVRIEPNGSGEPLTIGSTDVNFDLTSLVGSERLNSITIDHPRIELRYENEKGLNHKFNFFPEAEPSVQIGEVVLKDGYFSIEGPSGGKIKLTEINGFYSDLKGQKPNPFLLRGTLNTREIFTLSGQTGPGSEFNARLYGGMQLDREVPVMAGFDPGVKGALYLDFSARGDSTPAGAAGREPLNFNGTLNLKDFSVKIPGLPGCALEFDSEYFDLRAGARYEPKADEFLVLRGLHFGSSHLGFIAGTGSVLRSPALHARITGAGGSVDLGAFGAAFRPAPFGGQFALHGSAECSDARFWIPLEEGAPLAGEAHLTCHRAVLSVKGLGDFPAADASAFFDWPALKNGSLKFAEAGSLEFEITDFLRAADPSSLPDVAHIKRIDFDLGQFLDSPFGRRILAGTPADQLPPLSGTAPYALAGKLTAAPLAIKWATPFTSSGKSKLSLSGLNLQDAALIKWPFPMHAPACAFFGPIKFEMDFNLGVPSALALSCDLQETPPRNISSDPIAAFLKPAPAKVAAARIETAMACDAAGKWKPGAILLKNLEIPLERLTAELGLLTGSGMSLEGSVTSEEIRYDPASGVASGTVRVRGAALILPVSDSARLAAASLLRMANWGLSASLLQNANVLDSLKLSELECTLEFTASRDRIFVSGKTSPVAVSIKLPLLGDFRISQAQIPGSEFTVESLMQADCTCQIKSTLAWAGGKLNIDAIERPGEKWSYKGSLKTRAGEFDLAFDGEIDFKENVAGPLNFSTGVVKLASFAPNNNIAGDWGGEIRDLHASFTPFSFKGGNVGAAQAHLTGQLVQAAFSYGGHSIGQLDGPCKAIFLLTREAGFLDIQATLDSYTALISDGAFLVPPPKPGKSAALKLAVNFPRACLPCQPTINFEKCEIDVAGLVKFSAQGSATRGVDGSWCQLDLKNVTAIAPDMAAATETFGPPNLKNREPWFGDLKFGGSARFTGAVFWEAPLRLGIQGKVELTDASARIGTHTPAAFNGLNGTIPVFLHRGDWPARDGGERAKLTVGSANFSQFSAAKQELEIEGISSGFKLLTPFQFSGPGGRAAVGPLEFSHIWPPAEYPLCTCQVNLQFDFDDLLRKNGIVMPGLTGCILSGPPIHCALVRNDGLRGPWELVTGATSECKNDAVLTAPFYGGKLIATKLNARGLFGPAPAFGGDLAIVGLGYPEKDEGIVVQGILNHFPKIGTFETHLSVFVRNFETSSMDLSGLQSFTLDVDTAPTEKDEYWYDGAFAMTLDYKTMRASAPSIFSDDHLRKLTFGIKWLSMQFQLQGGYLYGPRPKRGDFILRGYGSTSNPFASTFKHDIKVDANSRIEWGAFTRALKEKLK